NRTTTFLLQCPLRIDPKAVQLRLLRLEWEGLGAAGCGLQLRSQLSYGLRGLTDWTRDFLRLNLGDFLEWDHLISWNRIYPILRSRPPPWLLEAATEPCPRVNAEPRHLL